jgi:hypothetical protein
MNLFVPHTILRYLQHMRQTHGILQYSIHAQCKKNWRFWERRLCIDLINHSFGGTSFLHLLPALCFFSAWLILRPWRLRRHVPLKRRLSFNRLHGVLSQNTKHFKTRLNYWKPSFTSVQNLRSPPNSRTKVPRAWDNLVEEKSCT